jgi:hypothetical protein
VRGSITDPNSNKTQQRTLEMTLETKDAIDYREYGGARRGAAHFAHTTSACDLRTGERARTRTRGREHGAVGLSMICSARRAACRRRCVQSAQQEGTRRRTPTSVPPTRDIAAATTATATARRDDTDSRRGRGPWRCDQNGGQCDGERGGGERTEANRIESNRIESKRQIESSWGESRRRGIESRRFKTFRYTQIMTRTRDVSPIPRRVDAANEKQGSGDYMNMERASEPVAGGRGEDEA